MKVKLADIIREAADNALNPEGKNANGNNSTYSCDAIYYYFKQKEKVSHLWLSPKQIEVQTKFHDLVRSMGCDNHSMNAFDGFREGIERQSVRYAWLELVALVAEDEDIEVEVE